MEILNRRSAVMEFVHQTVKERFWDQIFCLNTSESLYASAHSQMETGFLSSTLYGNKCWQAVKCGRRW